MKKFLLFLLLMPVLAQGQIITTIAGDGVPGYNGDGEPATAAELFGPVGLTMGADGVIFIADANNNCIRKVTASGAISTVAGICTGNGGSTQPFSGDGGPGVLATLIFPQSVATDKDGNLYITDCLNDRIRKLNTAGIINTIAGNGTVGFSGDGGPATDAELHYPWGIVLDSIGNIYFSDENNNCIRKISTSGIITTIAGMPSTAGFSGDSGQATAALLDNPTGITLDCHGNLYVSDQYNARIRKINPAGIISTYAGDGTNGYSGDGGQATDAQIRVPFGIATDNNGNLYIADANSNHIRMVSNTGIISTIAGGGNCSTLGDGGPATAACVDYPEGVMTDNNSNVYFSDAFFERVRKIASNITDGGAGTILGGDNVCPGDTIMLTDAASGGLWASSNNTASVTNGIVTAIMSGIDTIDYSISNYCLLTAQKVITIDPLPDAGNVVGPLTLCVCAQVTLSDSIQGGTWSAVNTNTSINAGIVSGVEAGTDTINYTVADICGTATATHTITVNPLPDAGNITGPLAICDSTTVTLADSVQGGTWSAVNTNAAINSGVVSGITPGLDTINYSVTNLCGTTTATYIVTVDSSQNGAISASNNSLSVPVGLASYQWTLNGAIIPGATTNVYDYTDTGVYAVIVIDTLGCSSTYSSILISDCGVGDIKVYPNPTDGIIYINWCKKVNARINTIDGKLLQKIDNATVVDIGDMPDGTYLLSLFSSDNKKILSQKITKLRR